MHIFVVVRVWVSGVGVWVSGFGFGVFPSPFFLRQAKPPCGVVPLKFWWGFDVSMKYEYEI